MKKIYYVLFFFIALSLLGLSWPFEELFSHPNPEIAGTSKWIEAEMLIIKSQAANIDAKVLRLSLNAYIKARKKGLDSKQLLTVIDYSKPSTEKRLWVFDLKNGRTLFNTWVSHGKNSGGINAASFSNHPGSLKSSFGVFVTDNTPYMGNNGYSLRMKGLEQGINDNAYQRDIVFHGAWYVNANTIKRYGQIGHSWGCPAVSTNLAKPLIDAIKQNTLIFAYYPDKSWLLHSQFLTA
jgi:hypothetical protein